MSERRRGARPRQPERQTLRQRLPLPGGARPPTAPVRKRRVSRAERDARRQRQITMLVGVAATLSLIIVAISAVNEYWTKPRTVLATVDGTEIRRREYWKVRTIDLINERNQYNQLYNLYQQFQPDQAQQYLQLAQAANAQLDDVWGSTDVNDDTLNRMIDDQIYLKNLDSLGLTLTEADVEAYILDQFDPADAPLVPPTATPTYIPTRAAWATETAIANETATASASAAAAASGSATSQPTAIPPTSAATAWRPPGSRPGWPPWRRPRRAGAPSRPRGPSRRR